ncbi:MAG: hypothetical protein IKZ48_06110 [Prevotella sp.]|nr:hypothetical protein [Prevotella sp.]
MVDEKDKKIKEDGEKSAFALADRMPFRRKKASSALLTSVSNLERA